MLHTKQLFHLFWFVTKRIPFLSEVVKLLLLFGANVNDPGGDHCGNVTPLHDASQNGHFETVKLLISGGANPLIKDVKVRSPLSPHFQLFHWITITGIPINGDSFR